MTSFGFVSGTLNQDVERLGAVAWLEWTTKACLLRYYVATRLAALAALRV